MKHSRFHRVLMDMPIFQHILSDTEFLNYPMTSISSGGTKAL